MLTFYQKKCYNVLYKSSRNVLGPRGACSPVGKNISDDNRYEHGAVRSNAGMRIPVSGTEAAKQRSDAGNYTVCGTTYRMRCAV